MDTKRIRQLNESLNPDAEVLDEGLESGINRIIKWINKSVLKKYFWTAEQKKAVQAFRDKAMVDMYNDIAENHPEILKDIQGNVSRHMLAMSLKKAGFKPDKIVPDEAGDGTYNFDERLYDVIQMLKAHHRKVRDNKGGSYSAKRAKRKAPR